MPDYDADHDGDQNPDEQIWIPLWEPGLTRFCLFVTAVALIAWGLIGLLTP